jgi:GTPase SAR1 family protein
MVSPYKTNIREYIKEKNENLSVKLEHLWLISREIHNRTNNILSNDNGRDHVKQVEENIWRIICDCGKIETFDFQELYILSCCSCCHDFYKAIPQDDNVIKIDHGEGSGKYILDEYETYFDDFHVASIVSDIISIHNYDNSEFQEKVADLNRFKSIGNTKIKIRDLAILFKTGDTLHNDYSRIPKRNLIACDCGKQDPKQLARESVTGWTVDGSRIIFSATPKSRSHGKALENCIEYIKTVEWPSVSGSLEAMGYPHNLDFDIDDRFVVALDEKFENYLNDTAIDYPNDFTEKIILDNIFIYPDLQKLSEKKEKISKAISSNEILTNWEQVIIYGEEQCGKTTLCKRLVIDSFNNGSYPILIDAYEINYTNPEDLIKKYLKKEYKNLNPKNYVLGKHKILIIDNYDLIRLDEKKQEIFIQNSLKVFDKIILIASESFRFVIHELDCFNDFTKFNFLLFGNQKREELITKWISLNPNKDTNKIYREIDLIKIQINSIIKNNIVPPKPFFLLTILSSLEAFKPGNQEITSYGHCYQSLIYKSLEKIRIKPNEIDKYLNFLTELSFFIFEIKENNISTEQFKIFCESYNKKFIKVDGIELATNLKNCNLVKLESNSISFKYKYIQYFYIAKYIAEHIDKKDIHDLFLNLLENLHVEENANIIVFITYHSKKKEIIEDIMLNIMGLFDEYEEATLKSTELDFMQDFIEELPTILIKNQSVEEEREKKNAQLDKYDQSDQKYNGEIEKLDSKNILSTIYKSFKSIEIVGQIIRNRYASIEKETLIELTENAYAVGLRFLNFYLKISETYKDEIVKMIEHKLISNPDLTTEEIKIEARKNYLFLMYGLIFSVVKKISFSAGSQDALEIYEELNTNTSSPAYQLIFFSILLTFSKEFELSDIILEKKVFKDNVVCLKILKEIIVQYIYLNDVDFKTRQMVSEKLKIPMQTQRTIQNIKRTKK